MHFFPYKVDFLSYRAGILLLMPVGYAVCTNLEDNAQYIARINKCRWEIEEFLFRRKSRTRNV